MLVGFVGIFGGWDGKPAVRLVGVFDFLPGGRNNVPELLFLDPF